MTSASLSHFTFIFVELLNVQKRLTDSCSLLWIFLGESRTSIVGAEKEFRIITVITIKSCINIPYCIILACLYHPTVILVELLNLHKERH